MDPNLRPDLTRILPRPVTRPVGGLRRIGEALTAPPNTARPDYLLDVERDHRPANDSPAFTVYQAQAAAERVAQALGRDGLRPGLFALDPGRTQRLLH